MTIIEQLNRLSKKAPDVCWQTDRGAWGIGDTYTFVVNPDSGQLSAYCEQTGNRWVQGRPALDWLEGALRQVIEARGWEYTLCKFSHNYFIEIWSDEVVFEGQATSAAEALLAALIKALEGEG